MFARLLISPFLMCGMPVIAMFAMAMPAMAQSPGLQAPNPEVSVKRVDSEGEQVFEVTANGTVKAAPSAVWKVLTDYEAMPDFVPDLDKTKVISRAGNKVLIEQAGVARFLFLSRTIALVVHASEEPISSIDIKLVSGDMKVYSCRWEMTSVPETGGTRIAYTGKMVPKFYVPGMLGANIIRRDIERMMKAVLAKLDEG